jgi:hypothetical protein
MHQAMISPKVSDISFPSAGRLPVLILAANDESRVRAVDCCLEQLRLVGDLEELDIHMEFFTSINSSKSRDGDITRTCDSGLVLVSTDSETGLPVTTHTWLREFFETTSHGDTAVVGLYACSPELRLSADQFHEGLSKIVLSRSFPYFAKTIFCVDRSHRNNSSLIQRIDPVDHWGLNE